MSRPHAHVATPEARRLVERGAAYGLPQEGLAAIIGIAPDTLRKHYRDELDHGTARLVERVASSLVETALDRKHPGHVTACIFILKTRGRWSTQPAPEGEAFHDPDPDV